MQCEGKYFDVREAALTSDIFQDNQTKKLEPNMTDTQMPVTT